MLSKISVQEDEDQYQHGYDIEIIAKDYLDPDPTPFQNQKPKWYEKLIEVVRNVVEDPDDRRRTMS